MCIFPSVLCVLHLLKISILLQCELIDKFYGDTEKYSGLLYQHGVIVEMATIVRVQDIPLIMITFLPQVNWQAMMG